MNTHFKEVNYGQWFQLLRVNGHPYCSKLIYGMEGIFFLKG